MKIGYYPGAGRLAAEKGLDPLSLAQILLNFNQIAQ